MADISYSWSVPDSFWSTNKEDINSGILMAINKFSAILESVKNGVIWVFIVGTVGDLILFYIINSNSYVTPQIINLGIQPIWLFIIWPTIVFLAASLYTASIEYGKIAAEEDQSTELNVLGLNRDWRIAIHYLCALDVMVNKKRKALGLIDETTDKEGESFKVRFEELIKEIKSKNKDLGKIIEEFAKKLWEIRTSIIHYGRIPNRKELDLIKSTSEKIINSLLEI